MCFGVRFSLYLASWLSDFDLFFSVCVVFGPLVFSPENGGGGKAPLAPLPGSAPEYGYNMAWVLYFWCTTKLYQIYIFLYMCKMYSVSNKMGHF